MDIQPIFRCAVGMDIHLTMISVSVIVAEPGCEPQVHRRQFGAFQRDRRAMADWIAGFAPDTVVMESTGIYWKSPYAALEKVGIQALVVNAQHVNKVPGRKTDTSDAEWARHVSTCRAAAR
jgi:transposase